MDIKFSSPDFFIDVATFTKGGVFNIDNHFNWAKLNQQVMHAHDHPNRFAANISARNANKSLICLNLLCFPPSWGIYIVLLRGVFH